MGHRLSVAKDSMNFKVYRQIVRSDWVEPNISRLIGLSVSIK